MRILELYDLLYRLKPSPVVALNRAIAMGKIAGSEAGLAEIRHIPDAAKLRDYPFYHAAQGEFLLQAGRKPEAARYFITAMSLARSPAERTFFEAKADSCEDGRPA
jgi:RNA polymerase sigma-70 factor (ECF subfamily)